MALACAVPSAVIAADACYLPQSTACYSSSSQPSACYPPQSVIFGAGKKDDVFALLPAMKSPSDDESVSQSANEQTIALACPVPHAGSDTNVVTKQSKL
jgi:hypothetical protein